MEIGKLFHAYIESYGSMLTGAKATIKNETPSELHAAHALGMIDAVALREPRRLTELTKGIEEILKGEARPSLPTIEQTKSIARLAAMSKP